MIQTRIAAHRGGALEIAENSRAAFAHAIATGAEEVEFDVHLSADGVPMVHHDATLDRTTEGTGPLAGRTAAELAATHLRQTVDEGVPTLDEVLALLAPSRIWARIEIKPGVGGRLYPGLPAMVLDAVAQAGMEGRAGITSFFADILRDPALIEAGLPRLALVNPMVFRCIGGLDGLEPVLALPGVREFALPVGDLDADLVAQAQARGLTPSAFATHTEAQIRKAFDLGLPVFTTDRPTLAVRLRTENPQARPSA